MAIDFFTVEVWTRRGLQRLVALLFIEWSTRKVEIACVVQVANGLWMSQIARNRTDAEQGILTGKQYLLHDRDPLFTAEFLAMIAAGGVESVKLPPRSPNLNAYAERFVRSIKESCMDRMIFLGERSLRTAVQELIAHYRTERNHQGTRARRAPSVVAAPRESYCNVADLDSIVLMALQQEPEQRYPGADALAEDLERYLSGKPVQARQGKASYYVRRWVVRHRWAFSAALIVLLAGSIAAGALVWEYRQSEWRFQQLRRFARSVVFEIHDSVEVLPGSTAARKLLVQRSLEYLRSLEASKTRDAGLKWELAEAYKRIGDAQGNPARANLGDSTGALDS